MLSLSLCLFEHNHFHNWAPAFLRGCFLQQMGRTHCQVVSDETQWLWSIFSRVLLAVISIQTVTCRSQQQLRGDGIHYQHYRLCDRKKSLNGAPLPCWREGDALKLPRLLHSIYDENKESTEICGQPMCKRRQSKHTSTLCYLVVIIVDTVAMFGIEFIIILTALLLKKRIAVYHSDVTQLLSVSR